MSRRQRKSFSVQQFFKNAAEVWASSPHLRSKLDFATLFSCCNCIFETVQFKQSRIMRIKVVNSDKATGQLQHAGRQKQGWNPLLPDAKDRFSLEVSFPNIEPQANRKFFGAAVLQKCWRGVGEQPTFAKQI